MYIFSYTNVSIRHECVRTDMILMSKIPDRQNAGVEAESGSEHLVAMRFDIQFLVKNLVVYPLPLVKVAGGGEAESVV